MAAPQDDGLGEPMADQPIYVVTVEHVEDIEELRNLAYAAAHGLPYDTTEHWDEPKPLGVDFNFKAYGAAVAFL